MKKSESHQPSGLRWFRSTLLSIPLHLLGGGISLPLPPAWGLVRRRNPPPGLGSLVPFRPLVPEGSIFIDFLTPRATSPQIKPKHSINQPFDAQWIQNHDFGAPLRHSFFNVFRKTESREFIAQGIVLEGFSISKCIIFRCISH